MKKLYNFVGYPDNRFDLESNPFSGIRGTLTTARQWAETLLNCNRSFEKVFYRAENGRKIYCLERETSNQ